MSESQTKAIDFFSSNFFKEFKKAIFNSGAIPGIRSLNSKVIEFKGAKPMSRIVKNKPTAGLGRSPNVRATPRFNKTEVDRAMESYKDKLIDSAIYCIVFLTEEHIESFNQIADDWDDYMSAKLDQANEPNANLADIVLKFKENINFILENYGKSHPNPVAEPEEVESEEPESSEAGDDTQPSEEPTTSGDGNTSPGEEVDEDGDGDDPQQEEEPAQVLTTSIAPEQPEKKQKKKKQYLDTKDLFEEHSKEFNAEYKGFPAFYEQFLGEGLKDNDGYLHKLKPESLLFVEAKGPDSDGGSVGASTRIVLYRGGKRLFLNYINNKDKITVRSYKIEEKQWISNEEKIKNEGHSTIKHPHNNLLDKNPDNITYKLTNIDTGSKQEIIAAIENTDSDSDNDYFNKLKDNIKSIDTSPVLGVEEPESVRDHYIRGSLSSLLFESIDLKSEWRKIWEV